MEVRKHSNLRTWSRVIFFAWALLRLPRESFFARYPEIRGNTRKYPEQERFCSA
jgi:hypothetical protein